jgi:hypothetical protein
MDRTDHRAPRTSKIAQIRLVGLSAMLGGALDTGIVSVAVQDVE